MIGIQKDVATRFVVSHPSRGETAERMGHPAEDKSNRRSFDSLRSLRMTVLVARSRRLSLAVSHLSRGETAGRMGYPCFVSGSSAGIFDANFRDRSLILQR